MYQNITGFGGAFTDSAATIFSKLNPTLQSRVLDMYFSADGLHYNMARLPIGSCDFSLENYNYASTSGDVNLTQFSIDHDKKNIIPFIHQANATINKWSGDTLNIVASPWSPPGWFKENHRRRKILKVGGAEYPIAREARAKFLRPRPLHVKPRPFLHDRGCYHEFLGEKINCKSSRIDLVAIEAYLLIIRPGKCLKIFIVTILGWRTMGALPPFLKYWGGYSPLSPPGSYAYENNNPYCPQGCDQCVLVDKYKDTWALYFSKFISAYNSEGINIWGVTIQNEPEYCPGDYECMHALHTRNRKRSARLPEGSSRTKAKHRSS